MRKIILLLLTVLTFTSCTESFRDDDIFIVVSKETFYSSEEYKYLYRTNHYMKFQSSKNGYYFLSGCDFLMNENYELGDTIKFIRHAFNEKEI
jgi:spermidine synthase